MIFKQLIKWRQPTYRPRPIHTAVFVQNYNFSNSRAFKIGVQICHNDRKKKICLTSFAFVRRTFFRRSTCAYVFIMSCLYLGLISSQNHFLFKCVKTRERVNSCRDDFELSWLWKELKNLDVSILMNQKVLRPLLIRNGQTDKATWALSWNKGIHLSRAEYSGIQLTRNSFTVHTIQYCIVFAVYLLISIL